MANAKLGDIARTFGNATKKKLNDPSALGEPEDQLRSPLERLITDLAELCGLQNAVTLIGETRLPVIQPTVGHS